MESTGHSRVGHVASVSLAGAHWCLSEALRGRRSVGALSVRNRLLGRALTLRWVEVLLWHWSVAGSLLRVAGRLILLLLQGLVLRLESLWLADGRLAVGCRLDGSHWLRCRCELGGWASFHSHWSLLWDGLGRDELLALWDWSQFLLSVVGDMLFILSSLFSQFLVDLLPEVLHELSHSSLHLLVNEVGNSLSHVMRNFLELFIVVLRSRIVNLLILDLLFNNRFLLSTRFDHWSLLNSVSLWFVS